MSNAKSKFRAARPWVSGIVTSIVVAACGMLPQSREGLQTLAIWVTVDMPVAVGGLQGRPLYGRPADTVRWAVRTSPLWGGLMLGGVVCVLLRRREGGRMRAYTHCSHCDYPRMDDDHTRVCPECGRQTTPTKAPSSSAE